MSFAVLTVIVFLAILLFIYILVISLLIRQKYRTTSTTHTQPLDYLVVHASQSGHATHWAVQTGEQLTRIGKKVAVCNILDINQQHLMAQTQILWIVSTYGEGDAPDPAHHFIKTVMSQPLDLSHLSYAIMALGDQHYANFCQFGQRLSQWLEQQQARPLFTMVCVDQLQTTQIQQWFDQLQQINGGQFEKLTFSSDQWEKMQFSGRQQLNTGSLGEAIFQIRLRPSGVVDWQSGDILEVQCENSMEAIQAFLQDIPPSPGLIEKLKPLNLRNAPEKTASYSLETWLQSFETLPLREYSIASLADEQIIELVIRQTRTETGLGLGSGWFTAGLQTDQHIHARIRSNPNFHLLNTAQPLILIGNGTGIAGLRAHLKQRERWGHQYNWLIFGERQQQFDHLYRDEIINWQQHGVLTYVDYAFSRDQAEKLYVQDIVRQQAERLKDWVNQGAAIYTCGSLQGMASGVDQALQDILGEALLDELKQQKRYQRDVY